MIPAGDVQWDSEAEYRLRVTDGRTEDLPGVSFVDGVSVAPANARTVLRLIQAFGSHMTIELWTPPAADPPPVVSKARVEALSGFGDTDPEDEPEATAAFVADDDDELNSMHKDELKSVAVKEGVSFHWNAGGEKLRKAIRDRRNRS